MLSVFPSTTIANVIPPIITRANEIPQLKVDADRIHAYVASNKEIFCIEAAEQSADIFVRPYESGLSRALLFTQTGRVIVHLNRKKLGDTPLGEGNGKKISIAIDLESLKHFASASLKDFNDPEPEILMQFQGVPGFAQIHHIVQYKKAKATNQAQVGTSGEEKKKRILLEFYNRGDLINRLISGTHTPIRDKKQILEDLVKAAFFLHKKGYLHRDFKPENIFLDRKNETDPLHAFLGDFGFACENQDEKEKNDSRGSRAYIPPEFANAILNTQYDCIGEITTMSRDIWSLGIVLSLLLKFFIPRWMLKNLSNNQILKMIAAYTDLPEPTPNSPEHLVWEMLRKDPNQRITAEEALEHLTNLNWSSGRYA